VYTDRRASWGAEPLLDEPDLGEFLDREPDGSGRAGSPGEPGLVEPALVEDVVDQFGARRERLEQLAGTFVHTRYTRSSRP